MKGLIGKKLGMTQVYDKDGVLCPVTVIEAGPCTVVALRTKGKDGYAAVQLGYGVRKAKNVSLAVKGHLKAAGLAETPPAVLREIRLAADPAAQVGDQLTATVFADNDWIDVISTSKGKGFQGVVRRHGFAGGRASHGGGWVRRGGSNGMKARPGRVLKGHRMAGHMGLERVTVQNLRVVQVRPEQNLLLVSGSVPGPNGGTVVVRGARKK
ncbi:MAG: 50S ribosomal protein L3 [Lentisphaeria bacterium]|jgi:large subunit ribosomal protein L3